MNEVLALYDTMSGRKEVFRPRHPPEVSMFVCGPTVQSGLHLGHARTYIFFDALARYLRHLGYSVFYLMNITDIDERISQAAAREREDPLEYSRRMTSSMMKDLQSLRIDSVSRFEPVSRRVDEAIRQVEVLLEKGYAYRADGWVYFDTTKYSRWGCLSHQSKKDLSLRPLELSPRKRNLSDFALWRPEVLVKGLWPSPWGVGSPGWHIQDTAVTIPILGSQYDLHGGAYELVYPHHEAEIAEAESVTGTSPLVRHWVHTNLVKFEGLKMSKSLGNVVTIRQALKTYSADEIRFASLSVHYRKDSDLSGLASARRRLYAMKRLAKQVATRTVPVSAPLAQFGRALNDDFDTPRALAWAERTLRSASKEADRDRAAAAAAPAIVGMKILGVNLIEGA
ncbi:MAG: class I tRNA ligase family protein [Nitrososphaerota archaeon]|nr:class I tRNA ligase family protein [Nitrososphaerota archaeon]MDG6943171.1 class I tRNA ligase family protein [Nitrososphaerota archaeon]